MASLVADLLSVREIPTISRLLKLYFFAISSETATVHMVTCSEKETSATIDSHSRVIISTLLCTVIP
jgi:hypothetical protein